MLLESFQRIDCLEFYRALRKRKISFRCFHNRAYTIKEIWKSALGFKYHRLIHFYRNRVNTYYCRVPVWILNNLFNKLLNKKYKLNIQCDLQDSNKGYKQ